MTDYLIKAALIQALCYGIYLLFLRNENQYNFRRWYLLATAGMALLMPAVQISVPQGFLSTTSNAAIYLNQLMATQAPTMPTSEIPLQEAPKTWSLWAIFYAIGVAVLTLIMALSLVRIWSVYQKSTRQVIHNVPIRYNPKVKSSSVSYTHLTLPTKRIV